MKMNINVQVRNVYGNDLVYPVCDDAKRFAAIAGSKTLSVHTLNLIVDLGYTVTHIHPMANVRGFEFAR
jgi:hypothetical protein